MSNSVQNHIPFVPQDTLDPAAGLNDAIRVIDALLNTRVISMTLTEPPSNPADGDMYIVASPATGAWAGKEKAFARYVADGAFWEFYAAGDQAWLVINKADGNLYRYNNSSTNWELAAGIGEAPIDGNLYGRKDGSWAEMPDVTHVVLSVNGQTPDTNGDVDIAIPSSIVHSVNDVGPDSHGNVDVPLYQLAGLNDQTGTAYTLAAGDAGKEVRCTNASAVTFSIDTQANVPTPAMMWCFVSQGGAGVVTIAAKAGVTLLAPNGAATTAQYDARGVQHISGDTWRVW